MSTHLYLSLMPEALIASMLSPEEFGTYYAVGSERTTQSQAIFFEVDPDFRDPYFPIELALERCVPHKDGGPKRSVYASVYRALEHVPLAALGSLYLVTKDGRSLGLERAPLPRGSRTGLHLYQELAPTRTMAVSPLGPEAFFEMLNSGSLIKFPALAFAELRLGELAGDPEGGSVGDLPYDNIDHLRSCLSQLRAKDVAVKLVDRNQPGAFPYRVVEGGVYLGRAGEGLAFYPVPPAAELRERHHAWWRSAQM